MNINFKSTLKPLFLFSLVFFSACESKWEAMHDDELAAKYSECFSVQNPGAAMIQVCKNYKRECERRRKLGNYIC